MSWWKSATFISIILRGFITFVPPIMGTAIIAQPNMSLAFESAATDFIFAAMVYALLIIPTLPTALTPAGGSPMVQDSHPVVISVALGAFIGMWGAFAPMIGFYPFLNLSLLVGDLEMPFWVLSCMVAGASVGMIYYLSGFVTRPMVAWLTHRDK